ncbi:MAG TPA: response regulator [Armatimonadota bacterium]|nr:response regulator [Armatimonadota bacterium]
MRERVRDILVVEDDDTVAATVTEILVRAGYEVERTRHGAEAVTRLSVPDRGLPDLLVLSIDIPMKSGIGVLRFLRETLHSRRPVVVLTAGATPEQEEEIRKLGASALLSRATSSEALLGAVRDALRQA